MKYPLLVFALWENTYMLTQGDEQKPKVNEGIKVQLGEKQLRTFLLCILLFFYFFVEKLLNLFFEYDIILMQK